MQLDGQANGLPGQWPKSLDLPRSRTPPPVMSPNVNGPVDPHEFYVEFGSPTTDEMGSVGLPSPQFEMDPAQVHLTSRSYSRSPAPDERRSGSGRAGNYTLNGARSNPVLLPSRQPGNVRDLAGEFNRRSSGSDSQHPALSVNTGENGSRQPTAQSRGNAQRSPVSASGGIAKAQRRRPVLPRSPKSSTSTHIENSSFSSTGSARTSRSQPQGAYGAKPTQYMPSRPLFGEITSDGKWNGNFPLSNYAPLPAFHTVRRGSEGTIAQLRHGRSQSHQDISQTPSPQSARHKLEHHRSRSDMDTITSGTPARHHASPSSHSRVTPGTSRIPIVRRRQSDDPTASGLQSRSTSVLSSPQGRSRVPMSPTRTNPPAGKENTPNSPARNRYNPPNIAPPHPNQMLSARIVAPPPKTSPPLRSSRPRAPVSSATTSASRARAAGPSQNTGAKDGKRPSEQWLGKPYDPQTERSKRKIPELGKIDFEERRQRIQKAISQNLEPSRSHESLQSRSRSISRSGSRLASYGSDVQAAAGADEGATNGVDQHQAEIFDQETDELMGTGPGLQPDHSRVLSLETTGLARPAGTEQTPSTGQTERTAFEDESPILGRRSQEMPRPAHLAASGGPLLLSAATYQPPGRSQPPPAIHVPGADLEHSEALVSPSILENVMRMRGQRSASTMNTGSEYPDDDGDLADRWRNTHSLAGDQGSIKIMLDGETTGTQQSQPWLQDDLADAHHGHTYEDELLQARHFNRQAFTGNGLMESPIDGPEGLPGSSAQAVPRKTLPKDDTLKPTTYQPAPRTAPDNNDMPSDGAVARMLDHYQTTGTITPQMVLDMESHMVDLHRLSANGGSNAIMIQSLMDSILSGRDHHQEASANRAPDSQDKQMLQPAAYELPLVTPDTPPPEEFSPGTVFIYQKEDETAGDDEDFEEKIRKADEMWARQQQESSPPAPPPPPPKDAGYTPRSSLGPNSSTFLPHVAEGLRISTASPLDLAGIHAAGERHLRSPAIGRRAVSPILPAPPLPLHAPPLPPPVIPFGLADGTYSGRASSEASPRVRKDTWATSSSRPSVDSQRIPAPLPASNSMSSIGASTRQTSLDTSSDAQVKATKAQLATPEQKRLLKRRHIIRELLDTENTYHQDLKILEDIYKGTCETESPTAVMSVDDKKVLFSNCDEIEHFALAFYDELRKAANPVYIPAKSLRWGGRRNSQSTMQSDGTNQTSQTNPADAVDDEKDRKSTIGACFLANMSRMEPLYGTYLRNHDAANKRLDAIQENPAVKMWLDECKSNASDITTAWDLDSMLVKPTQRVAKYPMLLGELLETTPADHPDHEDVKAAYRHMVEMLTRINEAKKRADLVDAMINRKRKDSDMRSGLAKAFGRRTEKLKERVGIAELHQDPEFDDLAHKFGGHFIRLQICMRDVQDYMNRTDKAVELISNYAAALELYTDVSPSRLPEIESKWRRYGQVIRDLTVVAFGEHRAAVQKRVLGPMVACIKLHEGPQTAINKRKKRVVDYAKCKAEERRGVKPEKRTIEASEMFEAINEQLKIDLPKLYNLTASLVQNCLHCFLDIQGQWHSTWERKLRPLLDARDIPKDLRQIETAFRPDYLAAEANCYKLGICNGSLRAEASNFLSPQPASVDSPEQPPSSSSNRRRPSTLEGSGRTLSVCSESANTPLRRSSGVYSPENPHYDHGRIRSNSSMSTRAASSITPSGGSMNRPWSQQTPHTSFASSSRPTTATTPSGHYMVRASSDLPRSPRPGSGATYFTARPELENQRFSGIFASALPPETALQASRPASPQHAASDTRVLFVCASLFEFSIDKTRREGGYPYLAYVQGEVFDVIAQKGELWLAKNQDDASNSLGWIWEQHFVMLSSGEQ